MHLLAHVYADSRSNDSNKPKRYEARQRGINLILRQSAILQELTKRKANHIFIHRFLLNIKKGLRRVPPDIASAFEKPKEQAMARVQDITAVVDKIRGLMCDMSELYFNSTFIGASSSGSSRTHRATPTMKEASSTWHDFTSRQRDGSRSDPASAIAKRNPRIELARRRERVAVTI